MAKIYNLCSNANLEIMNNEIKGQRNLWMFCILKSIKPVFSPSGRGRATAYDETNNTVIKFLENILIRAKCIFVGLVRVVAVNSLKYCYVLCGCQADDETRYFIDEKRPSQ